MSCPYYCWNNHYACCKSGERKDVNEDIYQKYCRGYDYSDCPIYKGESSSGGCFLTSACVDAMGMDDDCRELTVLRDFRDRWLRAQPGGEEAVAEYYRIAPSIVERIKSRDNAAKVFKAIYDELVLPCVEMINTGREKDAYVLYREYVLKLQLD